MALNSTQLDIFGKTLSIMAEFKKGFGRNLGADIIAEIYVAKELDLDFPNEVNKPGYDLYAENGAQYQVKYREKDTLNVDTNNFDFDFLVVVNLDNNFNLDGMWIMAESQAKAIFSKREKYNKFQVTQKKFAEEDKYERSGK